MNLFDQISKTLVDPNTGEIIDSAGLSVEKKGKKKDKDKYFCCVCDIEVKIPPKENERAICDGCLQKRKDNGNQLPSEYANKVLNMDVFEFLSSLKEDEIFDCVCSDPPFQLSATYGRNGKEILGDNDDTINFRFLDAVYPKMKNNSTLYLFCDHSWADKIKQHAVEKTGFIYLNTIIYVKSHFGLGSPFRNQHEYVLVLQKGEDCSYFLTNISNVLFAKFIPHNDKHIGLKTESHPHQKDVDVLRKIIRHSTREGEVIFDGFMGVHSLAVAALKEKRIYCGTELSEKWFRLGQKFLQSEQSKINMFE